MRIGGIYYCGQGVAVDYPRALAAYKIGAEGGDAGCQFNLGLVYRKGQGVASPDYEQALVWFEKAAAQHLPAAINELGAMALHGQAQTPSWRRARNHYQRAIDLGNQAAAENMQRVTGLMQQVPRSHAETLPPHPPHPPPPPVRPPHGQADRDLRHLPHERQARRRH